MSELTSKKEIVIHTEVHKMCTIGKHEKHTMIKKEYKSAIDLVEDVEANGWHPESSSESSESNKKWMYGSKYKNREQTHEVLERGDMDDTVMKYVDEYRNEFIVEHPELFNNIGFSMKRKRYYREDGNELSYDRIMTGIPEYWIRTERNTKQRAITLGIDVGVSWANNEKTFSKIAAMGIITADILTRRGVAIRLLGIATSHNCHRGISETVTTFILKDFHEPLDKRRIGSIHAVGLFRDYIFSVWRNGYKKDGKSNPIHVNSGLGSAFNSTESLLKFMDVDYVIACKWGEKKFKTETQKFITQIMEEYS